MGYPQSPATPMHHAQLPMNSPMVTGYNQMQMPGGRLPMAPGHGTVYNPPRLPEVYTLTDNVNETLPADVRQSFQHDADGRILFFTAPPLDRPHKGVSSESSGLGHSAQYLAGRKEWLAEREKKRKERGEKTPGEEDAAKRIALDVDGDDEEMDSAGAIASQTMSAMGKWFQRFDQDTDQWRKEAGLEGWRQPVGGSLSVGAPESTLRGR